jgi:flagellar motor switch/type III secretory pathway protein FliN
VSDPPEVGGAEAILRTVLATTERPVRFVVARRRLPTAEIVALSEGQVLAFPDPLPPVVELRVDQVTAAHGELVAVDGDLGVRVTAVGEPRG